MTFRKRFLILLKFIFLAFAYFAIFAAVVFVDTFILLQLWEWFVVPLGVEPIDFKESLGLIILVHFLTYHFYNFKKEDNGLVLLTDSLSYLLIRPLVVFLLACFAHFCL